MARKRRKSGGLGKPFAKADTRISSGNPSTLTKPRGSLKRFDRDLMQKACENEGKRHFSQLPGVVLRPACTQSEVTPTTKSTNDVVDLELLTNARHSAAKDHANYVTNRARRPSITHSPSLVMEKVSNQGFGVTVRFRCKGCRFISQNYKLFLTTPTGTCLTNLQAGIALSKVSIKAQDAAFLFDTLNVNGPTAKTYQHHFTASCAVAPEVLEESLVENRGDVTDYMIAVGRANGVDCPDPSIQLDGEFDKRVYRTYDGKASTVSEPVIENETGLAKLVAHAVVSKLDGSYPKDKVRVDQVFLFNAISEL